jgi:pimeloyl-ACP methyl ester carboxylesterase
MRPLILDVGVRRDLTSFLKNVSKRYTLEASQSFHDFHKPVLLVWGADDFIFPLRFAERLRNDFPNAKLEIVSNSRAFVPEDQPMLLAQYLEDFVSQRIGVVE